MAMLFRRGVETRSRVAAPSRWFKGRGGRGGHVVHALAKVPRTMGFRGNEVLLPQG